MKTYLQHFGGGGGLGVGVGAYCFVLSVLVYFSYHICICSFCSYRLVLYGKCPKISKTKVLTKCHMQTLQTQTRLFLKEPSDQGLHGLPFH